MKAQFTYWKESDGRYLGYLNDYPDHWTQGESLTDPFKIPAESDDAEAIALALERDRQLEAGAVQPLSHEELMSRLRR